MCRIVARPPMRSRITPTNAWSRTVPWTKPITHQNAWPGPRRTIQVTRPHSVTRPNAPTMAEPAAPNLLEGRLGLHVLGPQRGLDAVEQSLEPAKKLRLGNAYLRLAGRVVQRPHEGAQLLLEIGRQRVLQLVDRGPIYLGQAVPTGVIDPAPADLLDQLSDHRGDPEQLGGVGDDALALALLARDRLAARGDDLGAGPRLIAHADSLPGAPLDDRPGHRCGRGGHHHDHQDRGPEQQRHDGRGDPDQALVEDEVPPGGQD